MAVTQGDLRSNKIQLCDLECFSVGTHEHREAAMATFLIHRYRGLAVLVRSYRALFAAQQHCV
ncbi:hypothetical protein, partial [Pseudomonas folii]|uniref:hypothetical protein n=1 Tax=Pseudomonas folii TaxID=2762593 RepID=UPI001BE4C675